MYNGYMIKSEKAIYKKQINLNLCCGLELETEYGDYKITFFILNGKEIIWKFNSPDDAIEEYERIYRINSY